MSQISYRLEHCAVGNYLHYLWKRTGKSAGKPHDNYRTYNYHGVSPQCLQPFSIDSADFPCRDPTISSPRSFYGQNICSV
jgi:hypothetical protein